MIFWKEILDLLKKMLRRNSETSYVPVPPKIQSSKVLNVSVFSWPVSTSVKPSVSDMDLRYVSQIETCVPFASAGPQPS